MARTLLDLVEDIAERLRVADVIDILLVTGVVYACISLFRQSRSRLVMSGLATLVALYFAANLLEMHLTLALFQAGITVAAVALVVIFQDEIRRGFERVALGSRIKSLRADQISDAEVDTVVEAAATLAKARTGALIVFRGQDPLERHLTGGVVLNGRLSEPLLYSIFDASSAGHDGALIIDHGLVTCFAAHLPLSVEIQGNERFGTRHTAALGLSERCDALVVVVSEERGVVSVAQNGTLTEVASSADLKQRLSEFKSSTKPATDPSWVRRFAGRQLGLKLLSAALAITAWLVAFGYRSETAMRTVNAPVVFKDIPKGWVVDNLQPIEVRVSLSGPERDLQSLEDGELSVQLRADQLRPGLQRTAIASGDIAVPSGVVVRDIVPASVRFSAERTVTTTAQVQVKTVGRLGNGQVLKSISVDPPRVELVVPRSQRASARTIATRPVDLASIRRSTTLSANLELPTGASLATGQPDSVRVRIELVAQQH